MDRMKNDSQDHLKILTLSGVRIRHWMCCWKLLLAIIGRDPGRNVPKIESTSRPDYLVGSVES